MLRLPAGKIEKKREKEEFEVSLDSFSNLKTVFYMYYVLQDKNILKE